MKYKTEKKKDTWFQCFTKEKIKSPNSLLENQLFLLKELDQWNIWFELSENLLPLLPLRAAQSHHLEA